LKKLKNQREPFSVCTSKIVKVLSQELGETFVKKGVKCGILLPCKKPNPPSICLRKTTRWKKEKAWKMSHD